MKKYLYWLIPSISLVLFIIWTILVKTVDVHYITDIGFLGFYSVNQNINDWVKTLNNSLFDKISNILLIVSIVTVFIFAIVGLVQLIKRKSFAKVDPIIYILLGLYVLSAIFYLVFELMKINFSPLSTKEDIKTSYPSTHLFISCSYVSAAVFVLFEYFDFKKIIKYIILGLLVIFVAIVFIIRLMSGNHYFTDLIGGLLLTISLVSLFKCFIYWWKPRGLFWRQQ